MSATAELQLMARPVVQLEYVGEHRAAAEEEATTKWRRRFGQIVGRAALALGIAIGGVSVVEATSPAAAHAAKNYGDYLSGKYAGEGNNCAADARTLSSTVLAKSGGSLGVGVGPVDANTGADNGGVGVIELRWSEKCGTAWARLRTTRANDVTYIGIEKNDGYKQQRLISGNAPGSPAANSFTPMIYGRGAEDQFRAYVYSQEFYDPTPDNAGTFWMNPHEGQ